MTPTTLTLHLCPDAPYADAATRLHAQVAERFQLLTRRVVDLPAGAPPLFSLGDTILDNARTPVDPSEPTALEGLVPEWQLEAAILKALHHRGFLFLCVANSARSQLAEGIARSLAPTDVQLWSAGSQPTRVRPEAIAVLDEVGIDIRSHRAKTVSEVPTKQVDTVITLCGEEECPVFLDGATRLHWGLPDPAAVVSSETARREAFRSTREELFKRLAVLFG